MKRNFTKKSKTVQVITLLFVALSLSSCSVLEKRSLLGSAGKEKTPVDVVSRDQYNDLLKKYENLINDKQVKSAKTASPDLNRPEIIDALSSFKEPELAETVSVFDESKVVGDMKMPAPKGLSKITPRIEVKLNPDEIEKEIELLRAAQEFIAQNKFNKAMENLKQIENSSARQVNVNSKFLIGEILFIQKEYDLALQVFEEIVDQDAFSGIVLKTLGRLIVCSEKLHLKEKQERYYSLLHDFFES